MHTILRLDPMTWLHLVAAAVVATLLWKLHRVGSQAPAGSVRAAHLDTLTGLPRRRLFFDRLERAIARARQRQHQLAVYFVDLDRFKAINDSLGHAVGDRVLQVVAQRIRGVMRGSDVLCRLGGDEFTVLVPRLAGAGEAATFARRVCEVVGAPMHVDGRELSVGASVGVSIFPQDGEDGATLLESADAALYGVKAGGRGVYQLCSPSVRRQLRERATLEHALRAALAKQQFEIYYQPIVELATGRISTMEATLRWRHPERGLLAPTSFLHVAEAGGLIPDIGEWVLRTACTQVSAWRRELPELRAAVNVSALQLHQAAFPGLVRSVTEAAGLPPSALELDIPDDAVRGDEAGAGGLRELKALGVRLSIDDFGTGSSSLGALSDLPIDALKLDLSCAYGAGPGTRGAMMPRAVIALARHFGVAVIAECVETHAQLGFLRDEGCRAWQGHLFYRPLPARELEGLLAWERGAVHAS